MYPARLEGAFTDSARGGGSVRTAQNSPPLLLPLLRSFLLLPLLLSPWEAPGREGGSARGPERGGGMCVGVLGLKKGMLRSEACLYSRD